MSEKQAKIDDGGPATIPLHVLVTIGAQVFADACALRGMTTADAERHFDTTYDRIFGVGDNVTENDAKAREWVVACAGELAAAAARNAERTSP